MYVKYKNKLSFLTVNKYYNKNKSLCISFKTFFKIEYYKISFTNVYEKEMDKMSKKNNTKEKKQRNKRETHQTDTAVIEENIKNLHGGIEQNKSRYNFAIRLNDLLKEKKIDQDKFSKDVDVSVGCLSNYRRGIREPNLTVLEKIASKLNVSADYLLGRSECKKYSAEQIHNMLGLDEFAMEHLYSLKHNIPEVKELDNDEPISKVFETQLKILSLLISDKRNLIYILNTCNRYIEKKQELMELKKATLSLDTFEEQRVETLTRDIVHIKAEIQEYLYSSLDYITDKLLREESKK